jgi:hypothetical protein
MLALSAAPSVSYYQTLLFVLSQPCTKHIFASSLRQDRPQPSPLFGAISTISTAFLNIVQMPDNSHWLRVISVEPQSLSTTTALFRQKAVVRTSICWCTHCCNRTPTATSPHSQKTKRKKKTSSPPTGPSATQPAIRRYINYTNSIPEHSSNAG